MLKGGLEILIEKSIIWHDAVNVQKIKEELETVQIGYYTDQNKKILREMRVDVVEDEES